MVQAPQKVNTGEASPNGARLELLEKICNNVRSVKQQLPLISSITQMTLYALSASASSLLLLDEEKAGVVNRYSDGPLGKKYSRAYLSNQAGVSSWVMKNGKPLLVRDITKDERFNKNAEDIAGLVVRSVACAPLVIQGKIAGAIEVLNKLDGNDFNEDDLRVLVGLTSNAALTLEKVKVNEDLLYSYKDTIQKLVAMFDIKETTASKHSKRVADYSRIIATQLGLRDEEKQTIEIAAILHDIGLLSVPEHIINKQENLTDEEWDMIHKHPVVGYNLLRGIPSLSQASKLILYHHEKYNGRGYPCGLKGELIPIGARIIAVADAFDSMTIKQAYRQAMSMEDALNELSRGARSQFCPLVVKAFFVSYVKNKYSGRVRIKEKSSGRRS
jgi:HD-GYP domain-containing protein (c-di-GMP phosphodiesterase class II)